MEKPNTLYDPAEKLPVHGLTVEVQDKFGEIFKAYRHKDHWVRLWNYSKVENGNVLYWKYLS